MAEIEFYGADWCGDCRRSKALLNTLGVEFEMHDVEQSAEEAEKAKAISGRTNIPVIKFADGTHLVEPSDAVLHAELKLRGIIA
ncbi:NrdH-redoxin [Aquiluna borgnonia]|uniref:NrdH-redoxin n=1 Tax=Aquiluna borgnonia TaxID=2499157 RepID=A0A7D4QC65_9MICO|nr:glutaredoxin domain-containing protein [Aquiluna borgnonia]QKJ25730.1 NrdH-redoxin [Aquiluna borgnonia]